MTKKRLDILLTEKGFFDSRNKAHSAIMAGQVFVDGQKQVKAGHKYDEDANIEIKGNTLPYVSRGGLKLEKALKEFKVNPAGRICIDVGASTGGFTDCLLQNGAKLVYAVDVGYGQLAWKLQKDDRVIRLDKTNARNLKPEDLYQDQAHRADLATIDVSFISLSKIFPALYKLLADQAEVIALVKPQFEAGKKLVEKGGIVKDPKVHKDVLESVTKSAEEIGFKVKGTIESPITGADGNIEFLMFLAKGDERPVKAHEENQRHKGMKGYERH
ncbi:MAG: TlyA family RNA methyltransferase [Candidatus Margulisbacteria bacterium]|nr:TlyA family RNA methyltransferase [Candidatus Margulisiibacteriota bacterium]MBU1022448.1 TlyA family RNA methyltransferase [Candidatus Margulisiibacteriota bacterium]MBU1728432.1 TlyA family RNA methyltransferase [Candidatus Margulisiibacteriota bacterium]MBU1954579.1 TlyA family RNA methyltransferase [Candidatus Margulisiibacteriota bacterium]